MLQFSHRVDGAERSTERLYDGDEVDAYVARLVDELRAANAEIERLHEDLARTAQAERDLRASEQAIGRALLMAQRIADEIAAEADAERHEARRQASQMRAAAEGILRSAQAEAVGIEGAARREGRTSRPIRQLSRRSGDV